VFPEHLIAAHEALVERRRALRHGAEQRTATGDEWAEFEQHFLLRKVARGDWHRPYGTPCVHEHACFSELDHDLGMLAVAAQETVEMARSPRSTRAIGAPMSLCQ
jgi:hypothetical protein